jgi:hypothetical protein
MASISISPTTAVGSSNVVSFTVTGTGTNFVNLASFAVSGGYGPFIVSGTISSTTSASLTIFPGECNNGNVTLTDVQSGDGSPTATITITAPSLGVINEGFIGDSITFGTNGNPIGAFVSYLNGLGYTCSANNQGVSGSSTSGWLPSGGQLGPSMAAIVAAGATDVHIMLGTNDSRFGTTPSQYAANMAAITNNINTQYGLPVTISRMPWTLPFGDTGIFPYNVNAIYQAYWVAIQPLFNGRTVFLGDTGISEYSAAFPQTFLAADGTHPANSTENTLLGQMWAMARIQRLNTPPSGGSFVGGGMGMTALAGSGALLHRNPIARRRGLLLPFTNYRPR